MSLRLLRVVVFVLVVLQFDQMSRTVVLAKRSSLGGNGRRMEVTLKVCVRVRTCVPYNPVPPTLVLCDGRCRPTTTKPPKPRRSMP